MNGVIHCNTEADREHANRHHFQMLPHDNKDRRRRGKWEHVGNDGDQSDTKRSINTGQDDPNDNAGGTQAFRQVRYDLVNILPTPDGIPRKHDLESAVLLLQILQPGLHAFKS